MRRAVEEVKKLLVPAVSNRDAVLIPSACLRRRGSTSRCRASCLLPPLPPYRPREQVAEGTLRYRGGKTSRLLLREPHFISNLPLAPAALPLCPSADVRWYLLGVDAYFSLLAVSDQVDPTDEGPSGGEVC